MRTTQRTYDKSWQNKRLGTSPEPHDFTETTSGDAPASVSVEFSARGVAQLSVKVYKDDGYALANAASDEVIEAIMSVANELDKRGIVVAGISHDSIEAWRNSPGDEEPPF